MRVLIQTDVELYSELTMRFGDEIAFPAVPEGCDQTNTGLEIPDETAGRWRAARDAWYAAQEEAEAALADAYRDR